MELLSKFPIFEGMEKEELQDIAKICKLKRFEKGSEVFKAGDLAESLFLVNKGKVELRFKVSYQNASTEISLDIVSPGEALGWSALTPPFKYTLSAFAVEETEVLEIKERDIKRICQEKSHLEYVLMNNLAKIIGQRFSALPGILIQEIQQNLKRKEYFS